MEKNYVCISKLVILLERDFNFKARYKTITEYRESA